MKASIKRPARALFIAKLGAFPVYVLISVGELGDCGVPAILEDVDKGVVTPGFDEIDVELPV